ncbi:MAG: HTH domain-containing protein [Patescibacteria group bacterium]
MSKRKFTTEQITKLLKTGNVARCSDKAITYSKDFKLRAVKRYQDDGIAAKQIFKEAGFDLDVIGKDKPKACLKDWRRIFKVKGINGLKTETRGRGGGRPKTKGLTDTKKIEYLEAKVAYLKAENDFLAKLRAKRAE